MDFCIFCVLEATIQPNLVTMLRTQNIFTLNESLTKSQNQGIQVAIIMGSYGYASLTSGLNWTFNKFQLS